MNTRSLSDALACGQAVQVPDQYQIWEQKDGSLWLEAAIDGVAHIGRLNVIADADWPEGGPFASGLVGVSTPAPAAYHPPHDIREALNSPEFTIEGFGALMEGDPDFRTIVELMNMKTAAIEGVERLGGDLGALLGLFAENDIEAAADFTKLLFEQAGDLLDELQNQGPPRS